LAGHKAQFLEKIVQISLDLPEISHSGASGYVRTLVGKTHLEALLLGEGEETRDDIAVIARVLGSRHPRHVKRFLNDLAMSLAVLRNTGHLGEGDEERLPPRSVVAWHLLREALPEEKWREVRALTANLDAFLNQWRAAQDAGEEKKRPDGWNEGLDQLAREGNLDSHIALLDALEAPQRDLLVHTGSPPREVVAAVGRAKGLGGAKGVGRAGADVASEWVDIPGGAFQMGSDRGEDRERPVHEVRLSPYQIAKYPVTNAQYAAFVEATGAAAPRHWENGRIPEGKENHPVVHVSWDDANAFCGWLNDRIGQDRGTIGLPTEAQWEYAARGSAGRAYPWGAEAPDKERCNFGRQVGDTPPVGAYPKGVTPEGVHDLAGNVWEWTRDTWHDSYEGAPADGTAWESDQPGAFRVIRGGSWIGYARDCRCACRGRYGPENRNDNLGFRCARAQGS
jgi:formylglycine-generating enzyme required for sulfatase activity